MLAVVLPSRGLIAAEVLAAVDRETAGRSHRRFWSHSNKLPDCFNLPTQGALDAKCNPIWYVEEDTIPAIGCLDALLHGRPFSACPYKLHPYESNSWNKQLDFLWTGFGCAVVFREIFEAIGGPWFWTGFEVVRQQPGSEQTDYWELLPSESEYSGHDIAFCFRAYQAGFEAKILNNFPAHHIPKGEINEREERAMGFDERGNHFPDRTRRR